MYNKLVVLLMKNVSEIMFGGGGGGWGAELLTLIHDCLSDETLNRGPFSRMTLAVGGT